MLFLFITTSAGYAQTSPAAKSVPGFDVQITLSEKARIDLTRRHETLRVFGEIYGDPKPGYDPGPLGVRLAPNLDRVLPLDGHIRFERFLLSSRALRLTDGSAPQILLNVASGRKTSPENLLSCDTYQGALDVLQKNGLTLKCHLITEDAQ